MCIQIMCKDMEAFKKIITWELTRNFSKAY